MPLMSFIEASGQLLTRFLSNIFSLLVSDEGDKCEPYHVLLYRACASLMALIGTSDQYMYLFRS
ncbi:hypothetical protein ACJX0J_037048, partial [Zea mays]